MWNHIGCKFWGGAQVGSLVLSIPKNETTFFGPRSRWHHTATVIITLHFALLQCSNAPSQMANLCSSLPFVLGIVIPPYYSQLWFCNVYKIAHATVSVNELQHVENEHRYIANNWYMHMIHTIMHSIMRYKMWLQNNNIMLPFMLFVSSTCS